MKQCDFDKIFLGARLYPVEKFGLFSGEGVAGVKNVMSKTVFQAFGGLFMFGTSRHWV